MNFTPKQFLANRTANLSLKYHRLQYPNTILPPKKFTSFNFSSKYGELFSAFPIMQHVYKKTLEHFYLFLFYAKLKRKTTITRWVGQLQSNRIKISVFFCLSALNLLSHEAPNRILLKQRYWQGQGFFLGHIFSIVLLSSWILSFNSIIGNFLAHLSLENIVNCMCVYTFVYIYNCSKSDLAKVEFSLGKS